MELPGKHVVPTLTRLVPLLLCIAGPAAGQLSYHIDDGPPWNTNPPTYSCVEACALLFGHTPKYWY